MRNQKMCQRYLQTSVYTYVGMYRDFILSLPDDIPSIGMLVCDQITHPSMYFTEPSSYLEDAYYGKFASYPQNRFINEDELYITAVSMIAGILRLDETGFTKGRDVTKRITVSCRQASVLFSAILKAKGIPCRSRAGFMDFGDAGDSYMEHWVNEYWDFDGNRWALADVDGYYEYEQRFGYSQFDFFYSYQPLYLRGGIQTLGESELCELDDLARLMEEPDQNMEQLEQLLAASEKLSVLTNNTQNVYYDTFR